MHKNWLDRNLEKLSDVAKLNIKLLLNQYEELCDAITDYDSKIEEFAVSEKYKKKKKLFVASEE